MVEMEAIRLLGSEASDQERQMAMSYLSREDLTYPQKIQGINQNMTDGQIDTPPSSPEEKDAERLTRAERKRSREKLGHYQTPNYRRDNDAYDKSNLRRKTSDRKLHFRAPRQSDPSSTKRRNSTGGIATGRGHISGVSPTQDRHMVDMPTTDGRRLSMPDLNAPVLQQSSSPCIGRNERRDQDDLGPELLGSGEEWDETEVGATLEEGEEEAEPPNPFLQALDDPTGLKRQQRNEHKSDE